MSLSPDPIVMDYLNGQLNVAHRAIAKIWLAHRSGGDMETAIADAVKCLPDEMRDAGTPRKPKKLEELL